MESFSGTFVPFDWSVKWMWGFLNIFPCQLALKLLLWGSGGKVFLPVPSWLAPVVPVSPALTSCRAWWPEISRTSGIRHQIYHVFPLKTTLFTAFFCSLEGRLAIPKDTLWQIPPAGHHSKFSAFQGATIRPSPPCQYFSLGEILVFTWDIVLSLPWWSG